MEQKTANFIIERLIRDHERTYCEIERIEKRLDDIKSIATATCYKILDLLGVPQDNTIEAEKRGLPEEKVFCRDSFLDDYCRVERGEKSFSAFLEEVEDFLKEYHGEPTPPKG